MPLQLKHDHRTGECVIDLWCARPGCAAHGTFRDRHYPEARRRSRAAGWKETAALGGAPDFVCPAHAGKGAPHGR